MKLKKSEMNANVNDPIMKNENAVVLYDASDRVGYLLLCLRYDCGSVWHREMMMFWKMVTFLPPP